MWASFFDQSGQLQQAAVPELPIDSSDTMVNSASEQLNRLSSGFAEISDSITQALVNS
jgi:hypothetical protein